MRVKGLLGAAVAVLGLGLGVTVAAAADMMLKETPADPVERECTFGGAGYIDGCIPDFAAVDWGQLDADLAEAHNAWAAATTDAKGRAFCATLSQTFGAPPAEAGTYVTEVAASWDAEADVCRVRELGVTLSEVQRVGMECTWGPTADSDGQASGWNNENGRPCLGTSRPPGGLSGPDKCAWYGSAADLYHAGVYEPPAEGEHWAKGMCFVERIT